MQYGVGRLIEDKKYEAFDNTIKNFTRMTTMEFEHLTSLVEPHVKKMNTQFREAISVIERLAITLWFLSTDRFVVVELGLAIPQKIVGTIQFNQYTTLFIIHIRTVLPHKRISKITRVLTAREQLPETP